MTRTSVPPTDRELDDFADALRDEPQAEQGENESVGNDEDTRDHSELDAVLQHIGERMLPSREWQLLIAVSHTDVESQVPETHRSGRDFVRGYKARDVGDWIRSKKVPYAIGAVAKRMLVATAAEVIDPTHDYVARQVESYFGIPVATVEDACMRGQIRRVDDPTIGCHTGYLPGASLIAWIEKHSVQPNWSPSTIAELIRRERLEMPSTRSAGEQVEGGLIDEAFAMIEAEKAEESAEEHSQRASALMEYARILRHREAPAETDSRTLVEICRLLNFDRARVERDIALLERADALSTMAATSDRERQAMNEAQTDFAELERRHKKEREEARITLARARVAYREASTAPAELEQLRANHPELF